MMFTRLAWGFWALVPVAAVAYHYGPGQRAYVLDRAATAQNLATSAQVVAQDAQAVAYEAHLAAIDARRIALLEPTDDHKALSESATAMEAEAYKLASAEWAKVSACYQDVMTILGDVSPEESREVRWSKARADVRSGEVWRGIDELELLVAESEAQAAPDAKLATAAREELATAYYYAARLLRLSGMPPQEWRIESGKARQHFRYLAERGSDSEDAQLLEESKNHQRNLELVLNLEQSSLEELQGKPLPRSSPSAGTCNNAGRKCDKPGKGKKPGLKPDGRGAGGAQDIRDGW